MSQQETTGYSTIYIKADDREALLNLKIISPETATAQEVVDLIFNAVDIPESCRKDVVLKLTNEEGSLLPISPRLPPNTKETPFFLSVKMLNGSKVPSTVPMSLVQAQVKPSHLEDKITKLADKVSQIATTVQDIKSSGAQALVFQTKVPKSAIKRVPHTDPRYLNQPKYIFTESTIDYLKQPSFDTWQWEENEMAALLEHMFFELELVDHFKIEVPILKRFLQCIKANYNLNPFHNFRHCFCVTQMMYGLIHLTGAVKKLTKQERLILLVSCISHDLDHPGYNNAYQVNASTDLAIIYNDISPLEMHHAAMLFTIVKNQDTDIFKNIEAAERKQIRAGIIKCILATDMGKHGEICGKFKEMAEHFDWNNQEHRSYLLQVIVKCADISNEVRPTDVAEPWVDCLLEEFFIQSDREKAEGLPYAPFMDREKVTKAGAQIGFIGFVMIPLFELASKVLENMDSIVNQIRQSHQYYKDLAEKEKQGAPTSK